MRFEFATAGRVLFGPGTARELPSIAQAFGRRALVVTGRSIRHVVSDLTCIPFTVSGEPELDTIAQGIAAARAEDCDLVIAIGGGSAIDTGKAIAVLLTNPGGALEYLEVIGNGKPLIADPVPFIAVPTTAGTGSEVTRNAVIASREHGVKASLRSHAMLPKVAIVDPELTLELPPSLTASTGLDALTQLIEPYVCVRANAMTDALCIDGMTRAVRSLRRAFHEGHSLDARLDMSMASLLGGMALANAGLGAVHGFAAPIGGLFHAPHGAVCAALLPHAVDINLRALRQRAPNSDAIRRYSDVARILTGRDARPEEAIEPLQSMCRDLAIPGLSSYGIAALHIRTLVEKAAQASSMKANPIVLTEPELTEMLTRAL